MRVGASYCLLFGFVALLLGAAHVPTFILINAQIQAVELTAEKEAAKEDIIKQADEDVKHTQVLLAQLKKTVVRQREIDIVSEIEKSTSENVELKNFSIDNMGVKTDSILVQGVAKTREDLARFKSALVASPMFDKAEVPIADLVRDTDLPFTVTLTLTPQI